MRQIVKLALGVSLILSVLMVACGSESSKADRADASIVNKQQEAYAQFQPLHTYDYSQVRDSLIQIYDFLVQPQATFTVVTSDFGTVLFTCDSFGYPIAADTQLTNPIKLSYRSSAYGAIEQAEPTGIFSSKNTYGTYVLCTREGGQIVPVYTEGNVTTYPFVVEIVDGMAIDTGSPSSIEIIPGKSSK